jgi:hypothetical protein
MSKIIKKHALVLAAGCLLLTLASCNAKPFDYQPTAGEMKEGPGVFTGKDGELTIYDSQKGGVLQKDSDAKTGESMGEKTAETAGAAQQPAQMPDGTQDYREFQEFQQWQKEKAQFHEYQQWKKSAQDSTDFKEFQEYQQWQKNAKSSSDYQEFQEYQQWQKGARNATDYREFLEWKEFKAYQEWKKSQQ